ncbi:topoisomerase DNA-binding C4 zinc finger domain-containing protein, partial [bacterium]|nr:topoisomerase DNA-binding C4 zinc finger domain-containing protein [bacterium]
EAEGAVAITTVDGNAVQEENCPSCKQGALIMRNGRYGEFRSCSNFPVCRYKPKKGLGSERNTSWRVE